MLRKLSLFGFILLLGSCTFRLPPWLRRGESTPRPRPVAMAPAYLLLYEGLPLPVGAAETETIPVGCNDRLVRMEVPTVAPRLESVLTVLSGYQTETGSLLNPLPRIGVAFDRVEVFRGRTIVHLQGHPTFGGVCDPPRLTGVIEETVRLYEPEAEIWLNGDPQQWRCLGDQSGECR